MNYKSLATQLFDSKIPSFDGSRHRGKLEELYQTATNKVKDFLGRYNIDLPTPKRVRADERDSAQYGMLVTPEGNYSLVLGHIGGYYEPSTGSLSMYTAQLLDTDENKRLIEKYEASRRIVDYFGRKYASFRNQAEQLKQFYDNAINMLKNPLHIMVHELYHGLVDKLGIRRGRDEYSVGADEGTVELLTEQTLGQSNDMGLYTYYKERARHALRNRFGTDDIGRVLGQSFRKGRDYLRGLGYRIRDGYKGLANRLSYSY